MNRKGIVRMIEAVIAILIIFGVLLLVAQKKATRVESDLSSQIPPLLDELARNASLRKEIIESYDVNSGRASRENSRIIGDIEKFLGERITNPRIEYEVSICRASQVCSLDVFPDVDSDIFTKERIIGATSQNFEPKKVKLFLYIRE